MLNWLIYAVLVGGLLTLAAHCVGKVCHLLAWPTRWAWAGALLLTVVLAGVAPYRTSVRARTSSLHDAVTPTASDARQQIAAPAVEVDPLQWVRQGITTPLQETVTIPTQHLPASLDDYLTVAWGTLSAGLLVVFSLVYLRFHRARRHWPISTLHGVRVRIAPDTGPVVVGVLHPEIIIPQWLLGRSIAEQRAALTHEQEHINAADPWVLVVACGIAALLPWHPLVWWMLSRLRLAIELDCDTRVLKHGVAPRTYGSLLIDLAERRSSLPVRALALADKRSHLAQRLLAMKPPLPRFAAIQKLFFGASASLLLITASAAQVPPGVELQWEKLQSIYSVENRPMSKLKQTATIVSTAVGLSTETPVSRQAQAASHDTVTDHSQGGAHETQTYSLTMTSVTRWENTWTNLVHKAKVFGMKTHTRQEAILVDSMIKLINSSSNHPALGVFVSRSQDENEQLRTQMQRIDSEEWEHANLLTMMDALWGDQWDSGFSPKQFAKLDQDILENVRALEIIEMTSQDTREEQGTTAHSYLIRHKTELLDAYRRVQVKARNVDNNIFTEDFIKQLESLRSDMH